MKVYISYSRKHSASVDLILALISCLEKEDSRFLPSSYVKQHDIGGVTALAANPSEKGWVPDAYEIHYDENTLHPLDDLANFMDTLTEGDRIVLLISEHYFKSRFCMHELNLIYSKRAGKLRPCTVLMGSLDPTPEMETQIVDHWNQQAGAKDINNPDAAKRYRGFAKTFPVILAWLFGDYNPGLEYRHLLRMQIPGKPEQDSAEKL